MSVALTNTTHRIKVINLPHTSYCAALGQCACQTLPDRKEARVASSLTLPAGATIEGLSDAVLSVPGIARDIRAGEIRVQREIAKRPHHQLPLLRHDLSNRGDR
jgi:hypothetical protein